MSSNIQTIILSLKVSGEELVLLRGVEFGGHQSLAFSAAWELFWDLVVYFRV